MCTVSWLHQSGGYHLLFNRDEQLARAGAVPPQQKRTNGGIAYLAPTDPGPGGTWVATNEAGLTVCLLNAPARENVKRPVSRGALVSEIAGAASVAEALDGIVDPLRFAPFSLLAIDLGGQVVVALWDGTELRSYCSAEPTGMLTSSSLDHALANARRKQLWNEFRQRRNRWDSSAIFDFHCSHGDGDQAFSPCMHRSGAETVSFSWIEARPDRTSFLYSPGSPCSWAAGHRTEIQRRETITQ